MKKTIIIISIILTVFCTNVNIASASVQGITKDNYLTYEKKYKDSYGYNKGECNIEYLQGEEYFYNDYIDHWNVCKVYDYEVIKQATQKTTTQKSTKKKITSKKLAINYCKKYYKKYKVKFVKYNHVPKNRKSKKVIYIEVVNTISKGGKIGKTKDNYTIKYNKSVKKGKKVAVYLVYNPKNNSCDDVVAVACNNKIRGDKIKK